MHKRNGDTEKILDAAFKIGFMIVIVGLSMFYMPILSKTVDVTFGYIEFWQMYQSIPQWMRLIVAGSMLVGAAVVIGAGKEFIERFVFFLFGEEDE
jgi:hypothetical protein